MSVLRLHHIGQSAAEISPAVELCVQRFGYEVFSERIHDPLQTAFVQFLKLPGESSYLELVAPDGPHSKLANVTRRGGGLHHLCYIAGPLEAEISALAAAGMRLISDPTPAVAFAGRRICWLLGEDRVLIELVDRRDPQDSCTPGI